MESGNPVCLHRVNIKFRFSEFNMNQTTGGSSFAHSSKPLSKKLPLLLLSQGHIFSASCAVCLAFWLLLSDGCFCPFLTVPGHRHICSGGARFCNWGGWWVTGDELDSKPTLHLLSSGSSCLTELGPDPHSGCCNLLHWDAVPFKFGLDAPPSWQRCSQIKFKRVT